MGPLFVLGPENGPCVAEVVNRSLKADCTNFLSCVVYSLLSCVMYSQATNQDAQVKPAH